MIPRSKGNNLKIVLCTINNLVETKSIIEIEIGGRFLEARTLPWNAPRLSADAYHVFGVKALGIYMQECYCVLEACKAPSNVASRVERRRSNMCKLRVTSQAAISVA